MSAMSLADLSVRLISIEVINVHTCRFADNIPGRYQTSILPCLSVITAGCPRTGHS